LKIIEVVADFRDNNNNGCNVKSEVAGIVAKENSGQFKLLLLEYYEQIQYLQIKVVDGA
jgi:hypothetical protein